MGWGQGSQSHLDYLPEHTTDFVFAVLSEEFGWVGVVTVLALYLFVIGRCLWIAADARDGYSRLIAGGLIAIPLGLILLQPDFGTGMLVASSGVFALFLAGLSWWWFTAAFAGVAAISPIAWFWLLRPYQKDRILTFLNPESDPLGTGWNIIQSKIAIGAGGLTGKGWGQGSQSHLNYLPEHTTDFIFAVLSEEFGWIGVAVVLALYLFVVGRCLWIAAEARDGYSRLLAGSLGLAFFVYVIVNGGMISGMLPVVGVPMPLLSYGGTSAVSLLAGLGLVMAVNAHRPRHTT
jgi:rod shape determining protein RodA